MYKIHNMSFPVRGFPPDSTAANGAYNVSPQQLQAGTPGGDGRQITDAGTMDLVNTGSGATHSNTSFSVMCRGVRDFGIGNTLEFFWAHGIKGTMVFLVMRGKLAMGRQPTSADGAAPGANPNLDPASRRVSQLFPSVPGTPATAPDFKTPEGRKAFCDNAIRLFNGTDNAQSLQEALFALADLGNLEREIAGKKMPHGYGEIRKQFLAQGSRIVEFIQKQPPEVQEKILQGLASKEGSIAMAGLLYNTESAGLSHPRS
jgi:hypothetical protein